MTIIQKFNNYFKSDDEINAVKEYLTNEERPEQYKPRWKTKFKNFVVEDNKLIYKPLNLIVVQFSKINETLKTEYNDDKVTGKGIRHFYKYIVSKYINIKRDDVNKFLKGDQQYQMTRSIVYRTNKPIISKYPNQLWGIDLIDLNPYETNNKKFRYIITVVDIFSRKVWLEMSKDKTANIIKNQLKKIIQRAKVSPNSIMSDNGLEFQGEFSDYCKEHNIKQRFIRSQTPQANGVVERKNQEVRKILRDLMLKNNTLKWIDYLDEIEYNLNHTYVDTIKTTPDEIWSSDKEAIREKVKHLPASSNTKKYKQIMAQDNLNDLFKKDIEKFKHQDDFNLDDQVRVKMSSIFSNIRKLIKDKHTKQIVVTYTPEVFTVSKIVKSQKSPLERNRYLLTNAKGETLNIGENQANKYFYGSELLLVPDGDEKPTITMDRALVLNKVKRNNNDVNY